MRKVPVFLLAVCLTALLVGCAGQAVPLGGAQIGALSATAVIGEAVVDENRHRTPSRRGTPSSPKARRMLPKAPNPLARSSPTCRSSRLPPNSL